VFPWVRQKGDYSKTSLAGSRENLTRSSSGLHLARPAHAREHHGIVHEFLTVASLRLFKARKQDDVSETVVPEVLISSRWHGSFFASGKSSTRPSKAPLMNCLGRQTK
jgi:hypothetical protein